MTVNRRRAAKAGAITILGLVIAGLVYPGVPYLSQARRAIDVRSSARALVSDVGGLGLADINAATLAQYRSRVDALRRDVADLRLFVAYDPLLTLAGIFPPVRAVIDPAATLLAATEDVAQAAEIMLDLGDRFVALRDQPGASGQSALPGLVELLASSTAQLDNVSGLVTEARALLATIPDGTPALIQETAGLMRSSLDHYAPLMTQFGAMSEVVPGIVGWGGQKRYLVLAQDPAELRPAGGYVGTVGVVSFNEGRIEELAFRDVYHLDLTPGVEYVEPPEPLVNHLLGPGSWQLADANWSPDWPTAAQDALRLYTLESGDANIDGVFSLTTYAVDRLLEVTGPVDVPEYGVTVAAGEVTLTALRLTRGVSGPDTQRKAFLDDLAHTVIERTFSLPPASWPALLEAFTDMTAGRSLLAWFKDPAAQQLVVSSPMGGAVRQDAGDYMYIVEANLAPTSKYNLVVDRQDALAIQLAPDGSSTTDLRMEWDNRAASEGEPYASLREYSTSSSGLYGAYVRVLTAQGSQLVSVDGQALDQVSAVENTTSEAGRAAFGNYLLMGPGQSTLHYRWTTPGGATQASGVWSYRLTVQKQPGLRPMPVSVTVSLPAAAIIDSVSPGATVSDGAVMFATTLTQDVQIEIRYRLP